MPVIEYFKEKGRLKKISAVPPPNQVFENVIAIMDTM
jgi:adenylate kinase family enzyme